MQIYTLDLNVKERSFQISRHLEACRKVISTERVDLGTSLLFGETNPVYLIIILIQYKHIWYFISFEMLSHAICTHNSSKLIWTLKLPGVK